MTVMVMQVTLLISYVLPRGFSSKRETARSLLMLKVTVMLVVTVMVVKHVNCKINIQTN